MLGFLLWLILLVFCRPLALLALVLYPLVWLLLLPVRIVGVAVDGAFGSFGLSSRCRLGFCAAHGTCEPHADGAVPLGRPLPQSPAWAAQRFAFQTARRKKRPLVAAS